jgi:hypothetical protein
MKNQDAINILNNCLIFISQLTVIGPQQAALVVNLHNSISAVIGTLNKQDEVKEQSHDVTQHEICEQDQ